MYNIYVDVVYCTEFTDEFYKLNCDILIFKN